MKIEEIEISDEEMNRAIEKFLNLHGLDLRVTAIGEKGYPRKAWQVSVEANIAEAKKPCSILKAPSLPTQENETHS
jgi:hypothetical protein